MKDVVTLSASKEPGFQVKPILPTKVPSPVKVYTSNQGRSRVRGTVWELPEWDFAEIGRIFDSVSGDRFTYIRIDGQTKIISFKDLWSLLEIQFDVVLKDGREYIYPDNLEVLSGEIGEIPNPEIEIAKPRGTRNCCVPGCVKKYYANGYCSSHHSIYRKFGKVEPKIEAVWKKCPFITRHKVTKQGFLFLQKDGSTEVTQDHSLITLKDNAFVEFKPEEKNRVAKLVDFSKIKSETTEVVDLLPCCLSLDGISYDEKYIYWSRSSIIKGKTIKSWNEKIDRFLSGEKLDAFITLLGAYISEGSVRKTKNKKDFCDFRISQDDKSWLETLKENFEYVFDSFKSKIILSSKNTYALTVNKILIATIFKNLGGYQSGNKEIPEFIFSLSKERKELFKSFMIFGDESSYCWGHSYTTKSLKLASSWSLLLRLDDIDHAFSYTIRKNKIYYDIRTKNYFDKISSNGTKLISKKYDNEYVYDLEVEDTHNFIDLCGSILLHNTESFVRRAFRAKKNLFIKEGYSFVGQNPERIKYIKKRIEQIELASGIPFTVFLSQTVSSLMRQQNTIIVKVRDEKASGGKIRKVGNKELKPVAAYFLMPMESLKIKRNEYGDIAKYAQEIYGKQTKEFAPEDVIHFYLDKREGFSVGTPVLVPVKDDIRALRRIEENVELLVYQHLFPLFHYQVGTEDAPAATYADGTTEVDVVQMRIAQMPSDGCWVTPERHTIKPLSAESSPVAVEKIIEHFKQRIFIGLGVSSVDMGEGGTSSRSTADTMSRNLVDDVKADQGEFASQFYAYVIQELLLESTFDESDLFSDENKVTLKFHEIDFESLLAKENHYTDIFLKNAITHPELREAIGREPFKGQGWITEGNATDDWTLTSYGQLERDKLVIQAADEPGTVEAKEEVRSRASANRQKLHGGISGGNTVATKNRPENQHGVRNGPKLNRDFIENETTNPLFRRGWQVSNIYESISSDILKLISKEGFALNKIELNLGIALEEAKDRLSSQAISSFRAGLTKTGYNTWDIDPNFVNNKIQSHISTYTDKLRKDILDRLKNNLIVDSRLNAENAIFAKFIFDAFKSRVKLIDYSEVMRAYNYGLAVGYRLGDKKIIRSETQNSNHCEVCKKQFLEYNQTDAIIYEELPPLHPGCDCIISSEA